MTIRAIQIDDEPLAREKLANFLEQIKGVTLVGSYSSCIEAIPALEELQPDLLFLDIQMDQFTGIELLESIRTQAQIIIISAHIQYALKGYELNVTDYLLKPYSISRLVQATEKAKHLLDAKQQAQRDYLFVKTDSRTLKVTVSEIQYIEGMRDYLCIHTTEKKILTLLNFVQLSKQLPSENFTRIHKSFLVNLAKIDQIEHHRISIGGRLLPISKTYRESFYKSIGGLPHKNNLPR